MKLKKNWLSIALISLCCAVAAPAWAAPDTASAKSTKTAKSAKSTKVVKASKQVKQAKQARSTKLAQGKSRGKAVAKASQRGKQVAKSKAAPRARTLAARKPVRLASRRDAAPAVLPAASLNPGYVATAVRQPQVATAAASGATGASFGQIYGLHHTQDPLELKSSVALVVDQDTNEVLFAKNSGAVLPIASLTKLMTAMVMVESQLSLDDMITITNDDVDTEKNSSSRLMVGATLSRGELLHLALMASENRAAHALGRSFPGGLQAFVQQMNAKARHLGMADTRYVDPTGLNSGNQASAKDLATLAKAAYQQPLIRELSTSPEYAVRVGNRQLQFRNTNSLVRNPSWEIGLQKTGYIVEAGRCLVMQARMAGRKLIMVFLDSSGKYSRQADAERVRRWIEVSTQRGALSALPQRKLTS
jgi:serine-type D-Ala-D-Ala endopeptidase (penicillin-binding protein 7)